MSYKDFEASIGAAQVPKTETSSAFRPRTFDLIETVFTEVRGLARDPVVRSGFNSALGQTSSLKELDNVLVPKLGASAVVTLKDTTFAHISAEQPIVSAFPDPVKNAALRWALHGRDELRQRAAEETQRAAEEAIRKQKRLAMEIHKKSHEDWTRTRPSGLPRGVDSKAPLIRAQKKHHGRFVSDRLRVK